MQQPFRRYCEDTQKTTAARQIQIRSILFVFWAAEQFDQYLSVPLSSHCIHIISCNSRIQEDSKLWLIGCFLPFRLGLL